jgi:hypothetical protein
MTHDAPTYYTGTSPSDSYWSGFPSKLEMSREQYERCAALAGDSYFIVDAIMPEHGCIIYCDGPGRYYHVRRNGTAQEVSFDYVEDADRD